MPAAPRRPPQQSLYLVYEIEPDAPPPFHRGGKKPPAAFTQTPRGCYFATSERAACTMAAERLGRTGTLAAVRASTYNLGFTPAEVTKDDVTKLKKTAEGD